MLTKQRTAIANWISPTKTESSIIPLNSKLQAHPAQKPDSASMLYAPQINLVPFMVQYALNHWVYTAVNKLATTAASAEFMITSRPDGMERSHDHPLLALIGKYGRPNSDQDSFEFLEKHFQYLIIAGNSYWLWDEPVNGAPTSVYLLEPEHMKIVPGADKTIARYEYWYMGRVVKYEPRQITHFRKANPYNRYYGLSALQVLYLTILSDNSMLQWNSDFFDDELGLPSGIMVVPEDTSDEEIDRLRAEFTARHGEGRRVAFVKSDAGKAVWLEAALKHKDYDFEKGRLLSRRSVYEALDLPLGAMSENSTEANAKVAERQLAKSVAVQHTRTERKLNVDGLDFWAKWKIWQTEFEDIARKSLDWTAEKDRVIIDTMILSLDELRMREHKLPPLAEGVNTVASSKSNSEGEGSPSASGSSASNEEDE